ncbi:MAG: neutral zinc metallopeptidase, partial [Duncaniella sp.]|nr:neutral zinc metallopeptidase [Duncaniella sp.]
MRLNGRRQSSNFQDRRGGGGSGSGLKIGGGIGAVIIVALITWLTGGNPLDVLMDNAGQISYGNEQYQAYTPTAEEEELATFSRQILAG